MPEAIRYKLVRANPEGPFCEGTSAMRGQCPFAPIEGTKYCGRHGGNNKIQAEITNDLKLYTTSKWKAKIGEQADHPKIKSLNEEIGIMRIMISERLESCDDSHSLLINAGSISQMIEKLEHLVTSWHKISKDMGGMLDVSRAKKLALDILGCFQRYIDDPMILEALAEDVTDLFAQLNE